MLMMIVEGLFLIVNRWVSGGEDVEVVLEGLKVFVVEFMVFDFK